MVNLSEQENRKRNLNKTIVRVFGYLFCLYLIWFGFDILRNAPTTLKDILKGIGVIVAACVYLFIDIRNLISKSKRPNR